MTMMRNMLRALVLLAVVLRGCPVEANANVTEWKFRQDVRVDQPGLLKIDLPVETVDAARPGLEDLRIFDPSGKEVPYLVDRVHPPVETVSSAKRFQVQLEKDSSLIFVETGIDRPVDAIGVETSAGNFIKAVRVDGSNDKNTWKLLLNGAPIYRDPRGEERLQLGMTQGLWKFLRISVDDSRSEPIPVSGIWLHPVAQPAPENPVAVRIRDRKEDAGTTRLELDFGSRNIVIASLRVQTQEPLFTRNVSVRIRQIRDHAVQEQSLAEGTISRVSVSGQPSLERLEIPVERQVPSRDVLVLIDNQESPPIGIESVTATRRPVYVMFLARQAGAYSLFTGNPRSAPPSYDLSLLSSRMEKAPLVEPNAGPLIANTTYKAAEPIAALMHMSTPLDVSPWKYRKEVKTVGSTVQELELDLDVLSHARADFGDLRLIHEGKQFPYLLEHASWMRDLEPQVTPEQVPGKPRVSRWILKLPHSSLPVRELSCKAETRIFKRSIRLYERVKDERGSVHDRFLGQSDWVQNAEDSNRIFFVHVLDEPQTDTLILETDNGDNPALQLRQFTLRYPVTRLLFQPPAAGEAYLYYGNAQAAYPQYDIELAAQQLLESDRAVVSAGMEEPLRAPGLREKAAESAGILFWIALGIAVLALFLVVSRLLPKSPPQ